MSSQNNTSSTRARRRSLQHLHSMQNNESVRLLARLAVETAAQEALRNVYTTSGTSTSTITITSSPRDNTTTKDATTPTTNQQRHPRRPSTDSAASKASHSSFLSYQRAIHRGSKRGLFEARDDDHMANNNKHHHHHHNDSGGSLSLNELLSREPTAAMTATASKTTNSLSPSDKHKRKKKKKRWSILKRITRLKPLPNPKLLLASELSNEAWMCGVCSKSFSSFAAAERHEEYHIQEVVADLGWLGSATHAGEETVEESSLVAASVESILQDKSHNMLPSAVAAAILDDTTRTSNIDPQTTTSAFEPPSTPLRTTTGTHQHDRASFRTSNNSSVRPRPDMLRMSATANAAHSCSPAANMMYPNNGTPALQRKRKSKQHENLLDDSSRSDDFFHGNSSGDFDLTAAIVKPPSISSARKGLGVNGIGAHHHHQVVVAAAPMSPIDERRKLQDQNKNRLTINVHTHAGADNDDWMSSDDNEHDLLVPHSMRNYVILADEALVDVCEKAKPLMLTSEERRAEKELDYLAQDKAYYDMLYIRSVERRRGGTYDHFRAEGKSILSKVQNKFVDAYQLMKTGKQKGNKTHLDHYTRKLKGDIDTIHILENSKKSLYVNVIVKASLKVVSYELQRMAKKRWEAAQAAKQRNENNDLQAQQFQQFRAAAQDNLVKLAGMALAADFTPRRIAVQLSNDLYRLLTPRLKRRGVIIDTEIEYRVGPYFVLAVNVKKVDWRRLVKAAHRDVEEAKSRWKFEQEEKNDDEKADAKPQGVIVSFLCLCYRLTQLTKLEVMAQFLAWCYYFHCGLYTPFCFLLYHSFLGEVFRRYFLATVSDEIFYYVEQKGMEMDIDIRNASTQTAFMLSALREIRADGKELKKKQQEGDDKGTILGPLLGPAIKEDKGPPPPKPEGFEMPENLEYVGLELEIPVGFRRLRWALLASKSTFVTDAVFRTESKYENITVGPWSKYDEEIGTGVLPEGIKEEEIVGVEKELSYLMPKSAFVKANMCYETAYIDMYNDYCFVLRKKALSPEVPYGSTFIAWTKYVVFNTGGDSCKIICSVEAEFPNGPPMISRQIKGGMRAGVGELFVKTGETINKYADEFP